MLGLKVRRSLYTEYPLFSHHCWPARSSSAIERQDTSSSEISNSPTLDKLERYNCVMNNGVIDFIACV